jgi:hypothetical protein
MISTHFGEAMEQATRLFVYGTLRPGQLNFTRIDKFVVSCEPATIVGQLVDLGAFPALVKGDGIVEGDLLTLKPTALRIPRALVGHRDGRPVFAWPICADDCLSNRRQNESKP